VQKAKGAFRKILAVYPGLNLNYRKGRLILKPSRTAVPVLASARTSLTVSEPTTTA
jgi:hypothetical protein